MNYEIAVLAALVQIDKPTRPKISKETGISAQRVNTAINQLRDILGIEVFWHGAKRTGFYFIESWGSFETGEKIRYKAYAVSLNCFKIDRKINYDPALLKKHYARFIKRHNYNHSLKLEGFNPSETDVIPSQLSPSEQSSLRNELKKKYSKSEFARPA
jgi:biotin operon repressor